MQDMFEQMTKTMEKAWEPWKKLMAEPPWLNKPQAPFVGDWADWIGTMRSTFETNMSAWQTFVDRGEETFFKMYKDSPAYNEAAENQMRELWQGVKKAVGTQRELAMDYFSKMESLMKEAKPD